LLRVYLDSGRTGFRLILQLLEIRCHVEGWMQGEERMN